MTALKKTLKAENTSGIYPTEYRVLIKPSAVDEKTKGGIIIPDETKDRDQFAVMEGEIVAVSPLAFTYEDWKNSSPPQIGDKVIFAKFAGIKRKGKDGIEYRIIADKDIAAKVD